MQSEAPDLDRADAGALTPNQRGGQTRRERTKEAVLDAVEAALKEGVGYDDLRAADLARRAGIGTATFYQVVRHPAVAVGELLARGLESLNREAELDIANDELSSADALARHLRRLGQYGFQHRKLALAACRAYGSQVANRDRVRPDLQGLVGLRATVARLLDGYRESGDSTLGTLPIELPANLALDALLAWKSAHPENWETVVSTLCQLVGVNPEQEVGRAGV